MSTEWAPDSHIASLPVDLMAMLDDFSLSIDERMKSQVFSLEQSDDIECISDKNRDRGHT